MKVIQLPPRGPPRTATYFDIPLLISGPIPTCHEPIVGPLVRKLKNETEKALEQIMYYHGQSHYKATEVYPFSLQLKKSVTRDQLIQWLKSVDLFSSDVQIAAKNSQTNVLRIHTTFPQFNNMVRAQINTDTIMVTSVGFFAGESALFKTLTQWQKDQKARGHIVSEYEREKYSYELRKSLSIL